MILLALSATVIQAQSKEPPKSPPAEKERQQEDPEDDHVYLGSEVDVKAKITNRMDYYPRPGRDCPNHSWVRLRAVLHKSGKVMEIEIIKRQRCSLDEESVKVVRKYKFIPAQKDGRSVSQYQYFEFQYNVF
jgi:TonB family protein